MTNNTERKTFEASMMQLFGYTNDEFNFADGEYLDKDLNDLYLTWQAALAQREQGGGMGHGSERADKGTA
jgi:protein involved in sex pheromone biosynthesis